MFVLWASDTRIAFLRLPFHSSHVVEGARHHMAALFLTKQSIYIWSNRVGSQGSLPKVIAGETIEVDRITVQLNVISAR